MTTFWKTAGAMAAVASAVLTGQAAHAQTAAEPQVHAYWVCAMEVSVSQGVGSRMTLLGPAMRHEFVTNMYLATFETTETAQALAANKTVYAQAFAKVVKAGGYPTVSLDGDPGGAFCSFFDNSAGVRAKTAEYLAEVTTGGGSVHITYTGINIRWAPTTQTPAPAGAPVAAAAPAISGGLGGSFEDVTAQTARFAGLDPARGAMVAAVDKGGAAEKAGLRPLDIVTEINGQPVGGAADIGVITGRLRPGYKAPLLVWRNKAVVSLTVEIPAAPAATTAAPAAAKSTPAGPPPAGVPLGVQLANLEPRLASDLGRPPATGAVIAGVIPGGNASASGIRPLDIIVAINGAPVNNPAELKASLGQLPGLPAKATVWRNGAAMDVTLVAFDPAKPRPPQTGVCAAWINLLDGRTTDPMVASVPWFTDAPADEVRATAALNSFLLAVAGTDQKVRLADGQVQPCTPGAVLSCTRTNGKFARGRITGMTWSATVMCGKSLPEVYFAAGKLIDWRPPAP